MFFWNSLAFSMIQQMLAIWSLIPLPFLKPAWTSGRVYFKSPPVLAQGPWNELQFCTLHPPPPHKPHITASYSVLHPAPCQPVLCSWALTLLSAWGSEACSPSHHSWPFHLARLLPSFESPISVGASHFFSWTDEFLTGSPLLTSSAPTRSQDYGSPVYSSFPHHKQQCPA